MLAWRRSAPMAAAVAVAAVLGGCGSSGDLPKDIPAANADGLISNLNAVLDDCNQDPNAAKSAAEQYERALAQLPDSVDPQVRKILDETGANLTQLAGDQAGCESGATGTSGLQGFQPDESTTTTQEVAAPTTTTEPTTTTASSPPATRTPASGSGGGEQGPSGQPASGGGEQAGQGQPAGGQGGGEGSGPSGGVTPGKHGGR